MAACMREVVIIAGLLVLTLACGGPEPTPVATPTPSPTPTLPPTQAPASTPTPTPTAAPTPTLTPTPTPMPTLTGTPDASSLVFTITIVPSEPSVGDAVRVTAYASGAGGVPQYRLLIKTESTEWWEPSGILSFESPSSVSVGQLGVPVSWDLSAVRAGEVTLQVRVNYEKEYCVPTHCFYGFTEAHSGLERVSVRERLP